MTRAKTPTTVLANFQGPFSIHAVLSRRSKFRAIACGCARHRIPAAALASSRASFPYIVPDRRAGRARGGTPGQMDRGSARNICPRRFPPTNRAITLAAAVADDGPHPRARLGSGRGLRRASARPGAGDALSYARQSDWRLRHPSSERPQPRRRHQQDADGTKTAVSAGRRCILRSSGWFSASRFSSVLIRSKSSRAISFAPMRFRTGPRAARCSTPAISGGDPARRRGRRAR